MVPKRVVSKEKTEEEVQLPGYELVFIVSPEVVDENLDATIETVSQFITGKEGTVSDVDQWGKKRLAYPIKHFAEGTYVLVRFTVEPQHNKELETNLKISEDILRHLLIKLT